MASELAGLTRRIAGGAALFLAVLATTATPLWAQSVAAVKAPPTTDAAPPAADAKAMSDGYVMGSADVVAITVWNQQDLSGTFLIESDGTFIFPLLGRITAGGLTQRALEAELRRRLADGYFKQPQVTVAMKELRRQQIHIVGEVRQPGTYELPGDITVVAALARAGSTTGLAGHEAVIVRGGGQKSGPVLPDAAAQQDVVRVDLRQIEGGVPSDVRLRDGDTLVVPSAAKVYVSGHVKSPGSFAYVPGMTVLQAVSLAGGITDRGADGRIRIVRLTPAGEKQEIKVKLSDVVTAGDTIIVPERFF